MSARTLYCQAGQHSWDRPAQRGRLPKDCPDHRVVLISTSASGKLPRKAGVSKRVQVEHTMRSAICRDCSDEFKAGIRGRLPIRCVPCRDKLAEDKRATAKPRKPKIDKSEMTEAEQALLEIAEAKAKREAADKRGAAVCDHLEMSLKIRGTHIGQISEGQN